jgi:hypothetical protein
MCGIDLVLIGLGEGMLAGSGGRADAFVFDATIARLTRSAAQACALGSLDLDHNAILHGDGNLAVSQARQYAADLRQRVFESGLVSRYRG